MSEEISSPKVFARIILAVVCFGAILSLPAGTVHWINGWVFIISLSLYIVYSTLWLMRSNPELLRERLCTKDPLPTVAWNLVIVLIVIGITSSNPCHLTQIFEYLVSNYNSGEIFSLSALSRFQLREFLTHIPQFLPHCFIV